MLFFGYKTVCAKPPQAHAGFDVPLFVFAPESGIISAVERCLTNASIFQGNRSHKRIRTVADILPDGISQTHPVSGFSLSCAHPGLTLADDGIQRFFGLFRRLTYHRVSCCLYRNICPCRRRNEYIMNGRFSYKKYGDKPCQKWACLRSFFGVRLCVPACNIKWHSRGQRFDPESPVDILFLKRSIRSPSCTCCNP